MIWSYNDTTYLVILLRFCKRKHEQRKGSECTTNKYEVMAVSGIRERLRGDQEEMIVVLTSSLCQTTYHIAHLLKVR